MKTCNITAVDWNYIIIIKKKCKFLGSCWCRRYKHYILQILDTVLFGSQYDNITTRLIRLSCHEKENMWFFLMSSYGPYGYFLSVVTCISLVLYLLTSSDSGSLIIDTLSSNGDDVGRNIYTSLK